MVYKPLKIIYSELRSALAELDEPTACQENPDLFDPDLYTFDLETKRTSQKVARSLCLECPVVNQCAAYGLASRAEAMIWGGYSPEDIARLTTRNFGKNSQD